MIRLRHVRAPFATPVVLTHSLTRVVSSTFFSTRSRTRTQFTRSRPQIILLLIIIIIVILICVYVVYKSSVRIRLPV